MPSKADVGVQAEIGYDTDKHCTHLMGSVNINFENCSRRLDGIDEEMASESIERGEFPIFRVNSCVDN